MNVLKNLKLTDVVVCLAATAAVNVVAVPAAGFVGGVFAGVVGFLAMLGYRKQMDDLQRRATVDSGAQWSVQIDGITVGHIRDDEYAMTRYQAYGDLRLFVKQALALGGPFVQLGGILFKTIPALIFWMLIALVVVSPDAVQDMFNALARAKVSDVTLVLKTSGPILLAVFAAALYAGGAVRITNVFNDEVAYRVRQQIGVAANGRVALVQYTNADGQPSFSVDHLN